MKTMRILYVFCCALIALLSSCHNEADLFTLESAEDYARTIGFEYQANKGQFKHSPSLNSGNEFSVVFKIARPKTRCKTGFGLCDPRIVESNELLESYEEQIKASESSVPTAISKIYIDDKGDGLLYLYLANSPESKGLTYNNMPHFIIDENIEQPIEEEPQNSITIHAGEYPILHDLGEYGGFVVNVKYNANE